KLLARFVARRAPPLLGVTRPRRAEAADRKRRPRDSGPARPIPSQAAVAVVLMVPDYPALPRRRPGPWNASGRARPCTRARRGRWETETGYRPRRRPAVPGVGPPPSGPRFRPGKRSQCALPLPGRGNRALVATGSPD